MSEQTIDQVDESLESAEDSTSSRREQLSRLGGGVTVFDAMLLISLFCIVLATVILVFALREYSDFPFGSFPWRTDEAIVEPL